jgi:hypothetical protein
MYPCALSSCAHTYPGSPQVCSFMDPRIQSRVIGDPDRLRQVKISSLLLPPCILSPAPAHIVGAVPPPGLLSWCSRRIISDLIGSAMYDGLLRPAS